MMQLLAVALGGALGAVARYSLALAFMPTTQRFPFATFLANGLGCFAMGLAYVLIVERGVMPDSWRLFIMTGALGALTTFSTFSLEAVSLMYEGLWKLALWYVVATLATCLGGLALGMLAARAL